MLPASARYRVKALADRLKVIQRRHGKPCLIAVDGRSGTGKSTFAAELAGHLDAGVMSGDDFFAGGTEILPDPPEVLADRCVDRAGLRAVLQRLKAGQTARFTAFDWRSFNGSRCRGSTAAHPRSTLLLEGVYANHPDFRGLIDIATLLRVHEPERQRRLLEREGRITEWERQWHRGEDWYFQTLSTSAEFDLFPYRLGNWF